jgi:hypothetical protein
MLLKHARLIGLACSTLVAAVAVAGNGLSAEPAQIHWLSKPGPCSAAVGDLLVVTMTSNPSTGPYNPAANLKATVAGTAVRLVTVVYVPPARPVPGAPGKIQAFFLAEKSGSALLRVTPISGSGQPGKPWEFKVSVAPAE